MALRRSEFAVFALAFALALGMALYGIRANHAVYLVNGHIPIP